eukprot:NODE_169_length_16247_cov_0.185348.p5 type:complete len:318 gc:universal NODE_169_length_16247_cov_0.185348:7022-7975(+)
MIRKRTPFYFNQFFETKMVQISEIHFAEPLSENECLLNMPFSLDSAVIKKGISEVAVICTQNETFALVEECNSNTLLLVERSHIIGKVQKVIHAIKIRPNVGIIIKLMKSYQYKNKNEVRSISPKLLFASCGCSDLECIELLSSCYCILYKGNYCRFDYSYLFEQLLIYSTSPQSVADIHACNFISSYFYSCNKPIWSTIVKFVTVVYFEKSKAGDCRDWNTFKSDLKEFFEDVEISIDMLVGIAVVDEVKSLIYYIPEHFLPVSPEDRFNLLFEFKDSWLFDQIMPYLSAIARNENDILFILNSYCRLVDNSYYLR